MSNLELGVIFVGICMGVVIGLIIGVVISFDAIDTRHKYNKAIPVCEVIIPRNQNCELVISAKPNACDLVSKTMSKFKQYRRRQIAELREYVEGETLIRVSISAEDLVAGSPQLGDMVARNPKNHKDQWLVAKQYFEDNFEIVEQGE